jgi:hypothetical protein
MARRRLEHRSLGDDDRWQHVPPFANRLKAVDDSDKTLVPILQDDAERISQGA